MLLQYCFKGSYVNIGKRGCSKLIEQVGKRVVGRGKYRKRSLSAENAYKVSGQIVAGQCGNQAGESIIAGSNVNNGFRTKIGQNNRVNYMNNSVLRLNVHIDDVAHTTIRVSYGGSAGETESQLFAKQRFGSHSFSQIA